MHYPLKKYNVDVLMKFIYNVLPKISQIKIKLPLNADTQSFISWIYEKAHVLDVLYDENVTLCIECNTEIKEKFLAKCKRFNGCII